jgi:hypothetical protein
MGNAGYGNYTEGAKDYVDSERPDPDAGHHPSKAKNTQQPGGRNAGAPEPSDRLPPAGPHADPRLTNPDSTPGAGALTPPGNHDDIDSTSG